MDNRSATQRNAEWKLNSDRHIAHDMSDTFSIHPTQVPLFANMRSIRHTHTHNLCTAEGMWL